jgi:hypothetical protein
LSEEEGYQGPVYGTLAKNASDEASNMAVA